jgi:Zn-dependent M28 family amino/carboxypeptidase
MLFVDYELAAGWLRRVGHDLDELVSKIDADLKPRSFVLENASVSLAVNLVPQKAEAKNVLGLLPGADPQLKDQVIVLGAHFDHVGYGFPPSTNRIPSSIHNGADDNGSGTAALLELAEAFAGAPTPPRRTLLFIAFDAEERGLLGSRHYVEQALKPLSNTLAMVNFDQVGRGRNGLTIGGVGTSAGFKSMVEDAAAAFSLKVTTEPGGRGPSDHASFYNKAVPVLFFHTGLHPQYHRPSDDWPLIHAPELEQVTRLARSLTERLANQEEKPAFTKSDGLPFRRR